MCRVKSRLGRCFVAPGDEHAVHARESLLLSLYECSSIKSLGDGKRVKAVSRHAMQKHPHTQQLTEVPYEYAINPGDFSDVRYDISPTIVCFGRPQPVTGSTPLT